MMDGYSLSSIDFAPDSSFEVSQTPDANSTAPFDDSIGASEVRSNESSVSASPANGTQVDPTLNGNLIGLDASVLIPNMVGTPPSGVTPAATSTPVASPSAPQPAPVTTPPAYAAVTPTPAAGYLQVQNLRTGEWYNADLLSAVPGNNQNAAGSATLGLDATVGNLHTLDGKPVNDLVGSFGIYASPDLPSQVPDPVSSPNVTFGSATSKENTVDNNTQFPPVHESPVSITVPVVQQQSNGTKVVVGNYLVNATLFGNAASSTGIRPGATAVFVPTDGSNTAGPGPLTVQWQPTQGTDPTAGGEMSGNNQGPSAVNQFGGPSGNIIVTGGTVPNNQTNNISVSPPKFGDGGSVIGGTNINFGANASATEFQIPVRTTNNDQQFFGQPGVARAAPSRAAAPCWSWSRSRR